MGFAKPTTTQTPDLLFDYWQTRLTGAEMRVLLYAVRRTYGFKKDDDNISLDQFEHGITTEAGVVLDEGCGCSRKSILRAVKLLVDKDLLLKTRRQGPDRRDDVNNYRVHIVDASPSDPAQGFRRVNTTQIPDEVFDHWLPRLSDAELFVLLYVIRRTLGFGKPVDVITPEQFLTGVRTRAGAVLDEGCGVSRKHLYLALSGLQTKGLVAVERRRSSRAGNLPSAYRLVFERDIPDILRRSPDDLDPRMTPYDLLHSSARSESTLAPSRQEGAAPDTPLATKSQAMAVALEGVHHDAKGGAPRRQGGRITTPREMHHDAKGGASRRREGNATTPRGGHHDDRGLASWRPSQETDVCQETDISTDRPSKSSTDADTARRDKVTDARYAALVSQRAGDLSFLFHDQAHQRSNRTRALRLWAESGMDEQTFADMMQEARLIALKRGNITREAVEDVGAPPGTKNRMPYFFAVLEDLITMAGAAGQLAAPACRQPDAPTGGRPRQDDAPPYEETAAGIAPRQDMGSVTEGDDVWGAVLDDLFLSMTRENYAMWLEPTYAVGRTEQVLQVAAPSSFHQQWLTHRLGGHVRSALARLGQADLRVEFVVVQDAVPGDAAR